ncbi:hypothetical protein GGI19_002528 [Coemansia pectinata]|uniref:Uncharacterized protein n=1 Tax=Coemansia pectinata TaxID=1052879 RepID=A0A9W8GZX1_9FUNG|nr:hypothetical protein GGI19_002528 [Coemansia pectinata]
MPYQSLPMLVTKKIIEYLEGRLRSAFDDDIDKHNETKKILHPLLSVGEVWLTYPAWSVGVSYSQFLRNNLVKRVVVTAPNWRNMHGKNSRETIAWSRYNGAIFPSATTLVVKLNKYKAVYYSKRSRATPPPMLKFNPVNWRKGVVDFVCALLQLTPAVTGVSAVAISVDATHKPHRGLCVMLVSELCRGCVTRLDLRCQVDSPMLLLRLYDVSGLTSITHGAKVVCSLIARLAYLNARTLKELHISPSTQNDWDSLIKCGNKSPAVYLSLVSLSMDIANTVSANG